MDANEYALKVQPASKSLGLVLRKAVGWARARRRRRSAPAKRSIREETCRGVCPRRGSHGHANAPARGPAGVAAAGRAEHVATGVCRRR